MSEKLCKDCRHSHFHAGEYSGDWMCYHPEAPKWEVPMVSLVSGPYMDFDHDAYDRAHCHVMRNGACGKDALLWEPSLWRRIFGVSK